MYFRVFLGFQKLLSWLVATSEGLVSQSRAGELSENRARVGVNSIAEFIFLSLPLPPTQLTCCSRDLTITDFYLMATSPSLGNRTRTTSRRQWKPCISWAFHTMRSCVSSGASAISRVLFPLSHTHSANVVSPNLMLLLTA